MEEERLPVINFSTVVPSKRVMAQVMLCEENIKEIVKDAVDKAFYDITQKDSKLYKEFVNEVSKHARDTITKVAKDAVEKHIYSKYAKDIKSIVDDIGFDMINDFTKNFENDLRERLKKELFRYEKGNKYFYGKE